MTDQRVSDPSVPRWLWAVAIAFAATLGHTFIDYHLGLLGEQSATMSFHQGAAVASLALLYGFWLALVAAASAGDAYALRGLFWVTVLEAVLLNGALAVAVAPPPSDAFPFQDLFHVGSLVAGLVAARQIFRAQRASEPVGSLGWLAMTGLVILVVTGVTTSLQLQGL